MQLVTPPKYFKYAELNKGDVLIEEGKYLQTKEGKFGPQHYFEEKDGSKVCLNSAGQLNYLIDDNLYAGRACKIVYAGKVLLEKGAMAGKEAHNFDLYLGQSAPTEVKEETAPAQTNMDLNGLE